MGRYKAWSDEETKMLEELVKAGKNLDDMCLVFIERNRNSVRNKMGDMGLTFSEIPAKVDMEAFKRLMAQPGRKPKCV